MFLLLVLSTCEMFLVKKGSGTLRLTHVSWALTQVTPIPPQAALN